MLSLEWGTHEFGRSIEAGAANELDVMVAMMLPWLGLRPRLNGPEG